MLCVNGVTPPEKGWWRALVKRPIEKDDLENKTVQQYHEWLYFDGEKWDLEGLEPYDFVVSCTISEGK